LIVRRVVLVLLALPLAGAADNPPPAAVTGLAGLAVTGMTFVQSEGDKASMVVEADRGRLDPDAKVVHLDVVRTVVSGDAEQAGFELTCDSGELVLETRALLATGNVRGRTADGRAFSTTWVRYDPKRQLAFTDAPVEIEDEAGSLRGGGFRYHVREGRFRLLGGATVRREN
jgi:LPS export ABC transporter protein LptC